MGNKALSNQRVTVLAGLASGISDWSDPPLAELAALTNVSGAVNWNSFDLNIQASTQNDDRTLTDAAGAQSRGFTNFGGNIEFVMPPADDQSSIFRTAYNIFSNQRVELVVAVRYGKSNNTGPAAGDRWTIYHLLSDAVTFGEGTVSKFYRVALIGRDDILVDYIVPSATPAAPVVLSSEDVEVGKFLFASAEYMGHDITKAAKWLSSNQALLEEVHPGIFQAKGAGTVTIAASYPGAAAATPISVDIT